MACVRTDRKTVAQVCNQGAESTGRSGASSSTTSTKSAASSSIPPKRRRAGGGAVGSIRATWAVGSM